MAATYGYVYILGNEYMPDIYKIGCSERSPRTRAEELSGATGVPAPFDVLCYAEFRDYQGVEKRMHEWLSEYRINNGREFFNDCLNYAVRLLYFHPSRLSFTDCTAHPRDPLGSQLVAMATDRGEMYFSDMETPYDSQREEERKEAERLEALANAKAMADEESNPLLPASEISETL